MTPSAVALNHDQTKLLVTCSDANAVAVVDISEQRSRPAGFIPTGWYPTAVRALSSGGLVVLNGKGAQRRISPAVQRRVREVAAQRDYSPNLLVRSLQEGAAAPVDPRDALAGLEVIEMARKPG